MNIDIKNAVDQLLLSTHSVSSDSTKESLNRMIIQDLLEFIDKISIKGADERIALFKEFYLKDEFKDMYLSSNHENQPCSFKMLCEIDRDSSENSKLYVASLYINAVYEIGKYYLFNRQDKKDIDKEKFKNYLEELKTVQSKICRKVKQDSIEKNQDQNESKTNIQTSDCDEIKEDEKTLEELMKELNNLIGLDGVKREIKTQIHLIEYNKEREANGLKTKNLSKHMVFLGNPGTGKTTIARLVAKIYKQLGVLDKGQLVEVDRSDLVAGFVGQTAIKTKEKINEAMGGVLFIDEAYALAKGGNDFGQEAIDTLLKELEDKRDAFVVIVAGYPEPMDTFIHSNPGLASRFSKKVFFDDYTEEELYEIFQSLCKANDMVLNKDADFALRSFLKNLIQNKPENFANAREMRILFEKAYEHVANRISLLPKEQITKDILQTITFEDLSLSS